MRNLVALAAAAGLLAVSAESFAQQETGSLQVDDG